ASQASDGSSILLTRSSLTRDTRRQDLFFAHYLCAMDLGDRRIAGYVSDVKGVAAVPAPQPVYLKLIHRDYKTAPVPMMQRQKAMAMSKKDGVKAGGSKVKAVRPTAAPAKKKPAKKV